MIFTTNVADGRKQTIEFETDALIFSDWVGIYTWDTKPYNISIKRTNFDGTVYNEGASGEILTTGTGDIPKNRAKTYSS